MIYFIPHNLNMSTNNEETTVTTIVTTTTCSTLTKKRGLSKGATLKHTKTQDDWYFACSLFRSKECKGLKQSYFLRSVISDDKFCGSRSEQQSFSKNLKQFDNVVYV